jgi:hypothetical protein
MTKFPEVLQVICPNNKELKKEKIITKFIFIHQ